MSFQLNAPATRQLSNVPLHRFEAEERIKFHVENATKKLNDEWQSRMDELVAQHEEEKSCLKSIYEESCEQLREFMIEKCQRDAEVETSKAVIRTKEEMEAKLSEQLDIEVAQQAAQFQQELQNTLLNLEINDKDRMLEMRDKCLRALDVQSHLMACRQMTELLHVMTLEQRRWRMKNEASARDHQSNSIRNLWTDFLRQLDDVDGERLGDDENRILDGVRRFQSELLIEQKQKIDSAECFVVLEPRRGTDDDNSTTARNRIDCENSDEAANAKLVSSVAVEWERVERLDPPAGDDGSFAKAVFNRFAQPQQSMHLPSTVPELASSIMSMLQESKDKKELELSIGVLIQDAIMKNLSLVDATAAAVDIVAMPKTDAVHIKDSMTVLEKRVS